MGRKIFIFIFWWEEISISLTLSLGGKKIFIVIFIFGWEERSLSLSLSLGGRNDLNLYLLAGGKILIFIFIFWWEERSACLNALSPTLEATMERWVVIIILFLMFVMVFMICMPFSFAMESQWKTWSLILISDNECSFFGTLFQGLGWHAGLLEE